MCRVFKKEQLFCDGFTFDLYAKEPLYFFTVTLKMGEIVNP